MEAEGFGNDLVETTSWIRRNGLVGIFQLVFLLAILGGLIDKNLETSKSNILTARR